MDSELYEKRREHMFPRLAPAQIARLEADGAHTATRAGEVLIEPGERQHKFLVVLEGSLDVRSGSVKRIASGVGEGSICVQFVHRALGGS